MRTLVEVRQQVGSPMSGSWRRGTVFGLLLLMSMRAVAQTPDFPRAEPTEVGLSPSKLEAITSMLEQEVQAGKIAGAVAAIARHGRLGYLAAVGKQDLATGRAMEADTVFRIASMTKAITCAAVLSLEEDGKLSLADPLSKYLPEFAGVRVLESVEGDSLATVEAKREPTLHDLITHRSGLTYGWFGPNKLDALYREHDLRTWFVPTPESLQQRMQRLAQVPLKFQPGSQWDYGVSTDVLGRVIEKASGLTLDQFFRERFFRPLHMVDTHFYLPRDKSSRLAGLYTPSEGGGLGQVSTQPTEAGFLTFTADYCLEGTGEFYSGGGGLVSTTVDYLRFLQMLLNGGEVDGVRILRPETVARMTRNQIGDLQLPFAGHGDGFGFGIGVVTDRGGMNSGESVGTFSWGGIFNTYFWVDPQEQLVGILMTQIFPYDHLDTRAEFRRLAYEAIDDAGFQRFYWYEPGEENGNPHFNARQLRVNAPETSVHPRFASRSEAQSSGLARIRVKEDLRHILRADLITEIWGGHPGTQNKRVTLNGRSRYAFPEVGTAEDHCTHQYPEFNLPITDLVDGYNSLQFACDRGDAFWGHYIVDNMALAIGVPRADSRLGDLSLREFEASIHVMPRSRGEGFTLQLNAMQEYQSRIAAVHYQARYFGYDENGNGWHTDWHGMSKGRKPYGVLGTARQTPFQLEWDTRMLPAQRGVQVRAKLEFQDAPNLGYTTRPVTGLTIQPRPSEKVAFYAAAEVPTEFWSRANRRKECVIELEQDPSDIVAAELHVVTWTGGAGEVKDYFTLNGQHFPVAEGSGHETVYSRLNVPPQLLKRGANVIALQSDTTHHGIEVLLPGPALVVRYRDAPPVRLEESAVDVSAGDLPCYRVETPNAVYYLDKVGAGLSSMIDRDGHDWLSFEPTPGSGAGGEYRGFPNAVFREAGSYFHPRNAGTDPCVTTVEEATRDRVVISAQSSNRLWAGRYTFTEDGCTFTLTQKPAGRNYWVLYEGTPGGFYDDTDWWMASGSDTKFPLAQVHDGDLGEPEWIAFGDADLERMLVLSHHEDDEHPDRFYPMQKKMTVFGFGRQGMTKFLDSAPQSFSIGFVEGTDAESARQFVASMQAEPKSKGVVGGDTERDELKKHKALEQFALTHQGDPQAGREIFFQNEKTKCSVCHRVGGTGGSVGPDLSKIGGKFDRPHLIESLLTPSQQIVEGYRTSLLLTEDGQVLSGILQSRDEESVTILDANNRIAKIEIDSLEELKQTTVSLMPTGLADELSMQEFADLVAYLETLRTGKSKFGAGITGPIALPKGFEVTTITTGLSGATALEVAPDGRIFVCEQNGNLRVIKGGQLQEQPFVKLPVEHYWERGLIGVTVAPDFPQDPSVYVVYVAKEPYPHHVVSRFRAEGDMAARDSEEVLLRGDDQRRFGGSVPAGHQGGAIHFGNDGKLYIGIGEQTAMMPAQQLDALQGKLLRINADGSIPHDNPFFAKTAGKYQAIWAIGCRNPFTFAVQPTTGEIFINDVGGKYEEINRGVPGANYGWPTVEHGPSDRPNLLSPIHIYPQASISGGDFAPEDSAWPKEFRGRYFFADFVHGWLKTLDPSSPSEAAEFAHGLRRPVDLRFSSDGSLYVLLRNAWVVDDKFEGGTGSLLQIQYRPN